MALKGQLRDMSLEDLLEVFHIGEKSGVLYLAQDARLGLLYVSSGRLVDALVLTWPDRLVVTTSDAAVIDMLQWNQAHFIFHYQQVTRPPTITRSTSELIHAREQPAMVPATATPVVETQLIDARRWSLDLEPVRSNSSMSHQQTVQADPHEFREPAHFLHVPAQIATSAARRKLIATVKQRIREL